jgi:ribonuclease PH
MRGAGGRSEGELRPVSLTPHWLDFAEGSALATWGGTERLALAQKGIGERVRIQEAALFPWLPLPW